jgi:hypothetical protein
MAGTTAEIDTGVPRSDPGIGQQSVRGRSHRLGEEVEASLAFDPTSNRVSCYDALTLTAMRGIYRVFSNQWWA